MKIAFVFPGQGTQFPSMGLDLLENYNRAVEILEDISRSYKHNGALFDDIAEIMRTSSEEELSLPLYSHCAVYAHSIMAWEVFKTETERRGHEYQVMAVAGHSMGELAANVAAGTIDHRRMAGIVYHRGRLMQAVAEGGLLNVEHMSRQDVGDLVRGYNIERPGDDAVFVAIRQGVKFNAVGGSSRALKSFMNFLDDKGVQYRVINGIRRAFHTQYMSAVVPEFHRILLSVVFGVATIPLITNSTGKLSEGRSIVHDLTFQVDQEIRFRECVEALDQFEVDRYLIFGPGEKIRTLLAAYNGVEFSKVTVLSSSSDIKRLLREFDSSN